MRDRHQIVVALRGFNANDTHGPYLRAILDVLLDIRDYLADQEARAQMRDADRAAERLSKR